MIALLVTVELAEEPKFAHQVYTVRVVGEHGKANGRFSLSNHIAAHPDAGTSAICSATMRAMSEYLSAYKPVIT